jgi:hypothetical protein
VEQQWDSEGQREEDRLAGDEDHQLPSRGPRESVAANPACDELPEVIDQLPLDGQEPIERP